jgi:agmatinase
VEADGEWLDHWDFDMGGPLLADGACRIADLGNLPTKSKDGKGNRKLIETQTRKILSAGAVPLMFGGDDSTPVPFVAGFSGSSPLTILQIDAHIDWREERYGERLGFSSTMRRASEQAHVWRIVQAGARGLGSAREAEVRDAKQWGARIFTSRQIHHDGLGAVLEAISPDADCLICLDCDALDISQMPAVAYPSPGGLSFVQVTDLIAGVAAKARIAGFAMVEFVPKRDRDGTSAFTAARIAANVIGHIARQI